MSKILLLLKNKIRCWALFKAMVFLLLALVLAAWQLGWVAIYRPMPVGPVMSPFTAVNFMFLFGLQLFLGNPRNKSKLILRTWLGLVSLLAGLLLIEMSHHVFSNDQTILGWPQSSVPTLFTLATFTGYEVLCSIRTRMTILADISLMAGLVWIYLSFLGHITGHVYLTGAIWDADIGMSIPTLIASALYLARALYQDKITYTGNIASTVVWARKFIGFFIALLVLLPIVYIGIVNSLLPPTPENELALFVILTLFVCILASLYIKLLVYISFTHAKFQTICGYTHQLKTDDGNWVSLEEYLTQNYGLQLSHGISTEAESKLKHGLDDQAKS